MHWTRWTAQGTEGPRALLPKPSCRNQEHNYGHKCWGPCTLVLTSIHPEYPQDSCPTPYLKSACCCPPAPHMVQLRGPSRGGGASSPRPASLAETPSFSRAPAPRALQGPARCTYRPRAAGLRSQPESGAQRRGGGSQGHPLSARPAALLASHPEDVSVRVSRSPPGARGHFLPARAFARPAPLPRRPPSPARPLQFPGSRSPSRVAGLPRSPEQPAASLFGCWPFFNSQHTGRIKSELGAAVRLPGGFLLGGGEVDWGLGRLTDRWVLLSTSHLTSLRSHWPLGRPLMEGSREKLARGGSW